MRGTAGSETVTVDVLGSNTSAIPVICVVNPQLGSVLRCSGLIRSLRRLHYLHCGEISFGRMLNNLR
jgi:hypothetical protein